MEMIDFWVDEQLKQKCFMKAVDIVFERSKTDIDRIIVEETYETKIIKITEYLIKVYSKVNNK